MPFPRPTAGIVGPVDVRGDQKSRGIRVVAATASLPPAAYGLHREFRCVVIGSDVDPAGVGGEVVDPVGDGYRLVAGGEGMAVGLDRVLARSPSAAGAVTVAEPLLGFRVDADHRLAGFEEGRGGSVQVSELGIAVRMAGAFGRLGRALETEALSVQQASDGRGTDRMALAGQGRGQCTQRQRGPAQWRDGVAAGVRFNQCLQRRKQTGVDNRQRLATGTRSANPPGRRGLSGQLGDAARDGGRTDSRGRGRQGNSAAAERDGLAGQVQPATTLVQVQQDQIELGPRARNGIATHLTRSHASTSHPGRLPIPQLLKYGSPRCRSTAATRTRTRHRP